MIESQSPLPPVEPAQPMPAPGDRRGLAIAALVLGIISLCGSIFWFCSGPLAMVGIVLGVLSRNSSARSMANAGIILGVIGIVLAIVFLILTLTSGPLIQQFQHQLQQMQSTLQATP
jgi:hypothetical protein